jgi:ligand-binding sensor domain-containing protein/signal transduction histidine kinase
MIKFCTIAFALFIVTYCVSGKQSDSYPKDNYLTLTDHISTPNFGIVNCILRDDRGFIWFGTSKGLCKYDGYRIRVFPNGIPLDGPHQVITAMMKRGADSLLLATGKGLRTFNMKTEQFAPFLSGSEFSEHRINVITEDSDGTMWIGTDSIGLFACQRGTQNIVHYTTSNGLSDNRITSLLLDHAGMLWIGTINGGLLWRDRETSRFISFRSEESDRSTLWSNEIITLYETGAHEMWIGTDRGLNVLDATRAHMHRFDLPSPIRHTILSIAEDPSGKMWIAASDLELLSYSNNRFTEFPGPHNVVHAFNLARVLYLDPVVSKKGKILLWVGTRDGLTKVFMSTNPFGNHIRDQDSLHLDRGAVLSLCEDHQGILWVGLWGGGLEALRYVNGTYRRISHFENNPENPLSLPHNDVNAIIEDRDGNLWIGTNGGCGILDRERKQMVVIKNIKEDSASLLSDEVNMMYEDRSGVMWICTNKGLSAHIRGKQFRNFLNHPDDAHPFGLNKVSSVLEDHLSHLWVATYGRGLNRLEANGTFTRFVCPWDSSGSGENWIYTFVEDHEGLFWLSTMAGLVSFDPQTGIFERYPIRQLNDAHIFGIVFDQNNDVWLSTGIGLARFTPKTQSLVRYDEKDEIPFKEFFSAFYRNKQGRLFVGGINGFTEFIPESVSTTSSPPQIALTNFSIFDKEQTMAKGNIQLPYDQNFLSFSFAALDYANPQRNRFAYRMFGVDRGWVDAGTHNYASYPNLDPGTYVFQVKGSNSDNVWNESGTSISIVITPPYWQTWWFRIFLGVLIAGIMYAAYRYRLQKVLEVERLRLRIADDLHDDIGSNLSSIAMISRAVQRTPELTAATKQKLAEIYDTAVTTSEGMKDIVWFIKPKNDSFDDLVLRMKDTASALLADVGHEFQVVRGSAHRIGLDFKKNHFLAFKEILTNIVKHSSATLVSIQVEQKDGMLETVVQDNGKGFDPAVVAQGGKGNGLISLQNRATAIGGVCVISTELGKGTTVRFSGRT